MDFPNGNDAPNSSGCPNGTGSAPLPCAAPGAAGCMPHPREPPTVRQAPPETIGDVVSRILRLEEPPDELGPYAVAYHVKHGIVAPTREWLANEPHVYLDADHNVRTSSLHRDYSHVMAPVLGEAALMLAPGANALARGFAARGEASVASTGGEMASARVVRTIEYGEKVRNLLGELAERTYVSGGAEHAIITTTSGERLIVSGGPGGITSFPENLRRVIVHTHPRPTGPSAIDFTMLEQTGQRSSWVYELFSPDNPLTRFRRK